MRSLGSIKLFALKGSKDYGEEIAKYLDLPLSEHEEYCFDDGECYCGSLENVRGCDVFVIQSLYSDEHESVAQKLMKSLIFLGSLRDASAARITFCAPYIAFARQDRKDRSRAPITTKYMAQILQAIWVDRILCMDVHNPTAVQNAYHIPCDLLEANTLFAEYIHNLLYRNDWLDKELVVLSPDSGGLGRARKFRKILNEIMSSRLTRNIEAGIACLDKVHQGKEIRGYDIMGDVKGKTVIIYDDMISSGKTVLECAQAVYDKEAASILAVCATHGLFVGNANKNLSSLEKDTRIAIADTIRPFRLLPELVYTKLDTIRTTRLFAEAIARIHENESISDLINNGFHR